MSPYFQTGGMMDIPDCREDLRDCKKGESEFLWSTFARLSPSEFARKKMR
jgi:hypothetical protein